MRSRLIREDNPARLCGKKRFQQSTTSLIFARAITYFCSLHGLKSSPNWNTFAGLSSAESDPSRCDLSVVAPTALS